jgi:hypothetical protein
MVQNQIRAFIRGVMPFVESSIAGFIAHRYFKSSTVTVAQIIAVGGALWSAVLHYLEIHFPWVGVFLGWIGVPAYPQSAKTRLAAQVAALQSEIDTLKGPQTPPEAPTSGPTLEATGQGTFSADSAQVA